MIKKWSIIFAWGSLEILLHTYKINFGHLQAPLRFTIENFRFSWKMMKIWKNLQILKVFIAKKLNFLTPNLSQMMPYTSKNITNVLGESGDTFRYLEHDLVLRRSHPNDSFQKPPFGTYRTILSPPQYETMLNFSGKSTDISKIFFTYTRNTWADIIHSKYQILF